MTDDVLARVAELDHVTALSLGGSRQLTDDGLLHLARMPQLQQLDLSEYPGGKLTDRGLRGPASPAESAHVRDDMAARHHRCRRRQSEDCDRLEHVNLMGSPTGDGAIEALQGKPSSAASAPAAQVTDAGLAFLQNFPMLKTWSGR